MKALNDLREDIGDVSKRLSRIEKVVWGAAGGVVLLVFLIGWVLRPIINAIASRILNAG